MREILWGENIHILHPQVRIGRYLWRRGIVDDSWFYEGQRNNVAHEDLVKAITGVIAMMVIEVYAAWRNFLR